MSTPAFEDQPPDSPRLTSYDERHLATSLGIATMTGKMIGVLAQQRRRRRRNGPRRLPRRRMQRHHLVDAAERVERGSRCAQAPCVETPHSSI